MPFNQADICSQKVYNYQILKIYLLHLYTFVNM